MDVTPDPSLGQALRCSACGATLGPEAPRVASVVCPACGEVTRVPGALLQHLHAHRGDIDRLRRKVDHATEFSVGAQMTRRYGGRWTAIIVGSWLLAGVVALPETPLAYLAALVLMLGSVLVLVWDARRVQRRLRAQAVAARVAERRVAVACPTCGGHNELVPDEPVLPCGFCAGTLAADEHSRTALLEVAQRSVDAERRAANHEGWKTAAYTRRDPRTDLVPYFVVGGLGSLWIIGTVVTVVRVLLGAVPAPPSGSLIAMLVVSALIIVGVGAPLWRRRRRAQAWAAALESLAQQTSGTVRRAPAELADWLIAHWHDDVAGHQLGGGREYAVVCSDRMPRWALSVAPLAHDGGLVQIHARLFVAGQPSGLLVRRFVEASTELGWHMHPGDQGWVAEADSGWAAGLYAQPDQLRPVANALARATAPLRRRGA